jgi:hypothetical protein
MTDMRRKCVEMNCRNEGKYKVNTIDNLTLFVCGQHLDSWVRNGCFLAEKTSKKIIGVLVKYGIYSGIFFAGFYLILCAIMTWIGQYGISLYSLEFWLGSVFVIVAWIISIISLKRASREK